MLSRDIVARIREVLHAQYLSAAVVMSCSGVFFFDLLSAAGSSKGWMKVCVIRHL
jgi:hypothetical protein